MKNPFKKYQYTRNETGTMTRWGMRGVHHQHWLAAEFKDGKFSELYVYIQSHDDYNWEHKETIAGGTLRDSLKHYAKQHTNFHEFIAIFKK